MKKINLDLSTQQINQMIKRLEKLKKELNKSSEEIVKELSEMGLQEIQSNYAATPYKDGNDDVGFFTSGNGKNRRTIGAVGTQVLYNEFGTGTEGANSPHPQKGDFGLNAYNSGKTIRPNNNANSSASQLGIPTGEMYWTYMDGNVKKYTQGIPAGKQVYLAAKKIQKEKNKVVKKVVGEALSKL